MAEEEISAPNEPISVYEHIAQILNAMSVISWQKLGLQPDMATGRIAQNLPEAKISIDIAAYLADQLATQVDQEDSRRIQGLIRDLRINYVQKMKELDS